MAEFFRRGVTRIYLVPTITMAAPTVAQISAGTEITDSVANIEGFRYSNSRIPIPKMSSDFTPTIRGENTADDSTLTFYEDDASNPLRTTLAKGTQTNVVIFSVGTAGASPAIGDKVDIWPVESAATPKEFTMGNDPARWMAELGNTDVPFEDETLV